MTTTPKPAPSEDAVSALKAVVAQCEANHGRLPMAPEVQAIYDRCVAAIAKASLATIPAAEPETRDWAFGNGEFVVTDGTWKGRPAVFISPAKSPGAANTPISASEREQQPLDRLAGGEVALTFPTAEQASYVLDALFNRPRGSGLTGATPQIALRKVKPLDLSILLEHAFLSGRGVSARDGISDADQKALSGYDPSNLSCFQRIRSALVAPQPARETWLVDRETLAEAARDQSLSDAVVRSLCLAQRGKVTAEIEAWAEQVMATALRARCQP